VPGVHGELVGIIAGREAGLAAAARNASTTRNDAEMTVADSMMALQALMLRRSPGGMLDNPRSSSKGEYALPVQQLVRLRPRTVENYSDR
jgi:hypothetical protein